MKFAVFLVLVAVVALSAGEEFKCKQEVPYIENECNDCSCGPEGGMRCTEQACIGPETKQLQNCVVGTTSEKGCNKCWCVKNLGTICTNTKC